VLMLHMTTGFGGPQTDGLFEEGVHDALMVGATGGVIARAITVRAQRAAWLAMGAGLMCWSLGELYYTLFLEGPHGAGAGITPANGLYLAMYPCMYVALMLLVGANLRELRVSMWLDGLIAGLAAAALAAALILPPILAGAHGDTVSVAVSLAYPIGDILLLMFTIVALGMTGWRPGRVWLLIAASMLLNAIADSAYVYETATGAHTPDRWLQAMWPASAVLLAVAAWAPWPRVARKRIEDWRLVLVPAASLLGALGVLVLGNFPAVQLTPVAVILAAATVLAVCARLMVTVRENLTMLAGSRSLASTDPLTGLSNRRQLMEDLDLACRLAGPSRSWRLVIYDLNGFKRYNDTFGHPAGDALLERLAGKLRASVAAHGTAYRMGGDEFCVLLDGTDAGAPALERRSVQALSEHGPGFAIGAAHGGVSIPREAREPSQALALADQRLYQRKDRSPGLQDPHPSSSGLQDAFVATLDAGAPARVLGRGRDGVFQPPTAVTAFAETTTTTAADTTPPARVTP
jgi:two-component system, cell cycle response regulator